VHRRPVAAQRFPVPAGRPAAAWLSAVVRVDRRRTGQSPQPRMEQEPSCLPERSAGRRRGTLAHRQCPAVRLGRGRHLHRRVRA
jgi:hypothetical protein